MRDTWNKYIARLIPDSIEDARQYLSGCVQLVCIRGSACTQSRHLGLIKGRRDACGCRRDLSDQARGERGMGVSAGDCVSVLSVGKSVLSVAVVVSFFCVHACVSETP